MAARPAVNNRDVLAIDEARFLEALPERCRERRIGVGRLAAEEADHRYCRLLRARRERPAKSRASECGHEPPSSDCQSPRAQCVHARCNAEQNTTPLSTRLGPNGACPSAAIRSPLG